MRKWMVMAGLAAAVVALMLLLPGTLRRPAPDAPHPAPEAAHPPPDGLPPAPGATRPGAAGDAPEEPFHHELVDEAARAMLAYPITMKRLESYVAAVKEIRTAAQKDAALLARLREPGPVGEAPAAMGARLEAIGPLKAVLVRHGLGGIDLVYLPRVMLAARNAYALEQEGRPLPPEEVNAAATALYRADLPKVDELNKSFLADLAFLSGR